jgi:uncharacterized Rossmann fold enzyme
MVKNLKKQINFFDEFKEWYFKIITEFKFNIQEDRDARDFLSYILMQSSIIWNLEDILKSFKDIIQSKSNILVYGCGPSLEITMEKFKDKLLFNKSVNLAADGAAVFLKEKQIPVDGIFTDLDGITINEFNYPEFIIVHAHGDNIKKLKAFREKMINFKKIIGTTQVEPIKDILNPGGFTDGDRILFFIKSFLLPYHRIFLIGMDFNNIIGRYSKPELTEHQVASPAKLKKLRYAIKLVEWFKTQVVNEIYFVNSKFESKYFKNFKSISTSEFKKMLLN